MSEDDLKKVAMEIAAAGRSGFDVNNPAKQYHLKNLSGVYTGLEMVCYLYVAVQMIAPGTGNRFNLSREYEAAKGLIGQSNIELSDSLPKGSTVIKGEINVEPM